MEGGIIGLDMKSTSATGTELMLYDSGMSDGQYGIRVENAGFFIMYHGVAWTNDNVIELINVSNAEFQYTEMRAAQGYGLRALGNSTVKMGFAAFLTPQTVYVDATSSVTMAQCHHNYVDL